MSKAKASTMACDMDDEVIAPKSQRRPLHKGETVPHIPTMHEQMDMACAAANRSKPKPR
jgi:hypothetical protein